MKIGVMVESFRQGLAGGLAAAAAVGASGVQIYATGGEMDARKLGPADRAALRRRIGDLRLEVSALCADFGGHGFMVEANNAKRVDDSKRVMDLALDMGSKVVTTHIGVVPSDKRDPSYAVLARACEALARYGDSAGATFAIETGPEPADVLGSFIEDVGPGKGLGVNFDPANLAMICREDIPKAVARLGKYIVHTHAKDGLSLLPVDPGKLYRSFAEPIPGFNAGDYYREVPLGEGAVDFSKYLPALKAVGFDGYLTIEREAGENPVDDIRRAVDFLRELLAGIK